MSPLFDLHCEKCGNELVDVWLKCDEPTGLCKICGDILIKVPGGHFKLLYDPKKDSCGWAFNGYDHSCYWDAVKKAKAEGQKNVRGVNEQ